MSKKSVYASLILLSVLTLVACSKEQDKQVVTSSSSSSSVVESSSSSVVESSSSSESTYDSSSSEEEVEEDEQEEKRFDLDLSVLRSYGYTVPTDVQKYAGSYSAQADIEDKDGSFVVDLTINGNGTFRKVIKNYRKSTDEGDIFYIKPGNDRKYGYFDTNDKFNLIELPERTIEGEHFIDAPDDITYTQGVLVEKYGDIYLVDLFELGGWTPAIYLTQSGEVDEIATLLNYHFHESHYFGDPIPSVHDLKTPGLNVLNLELKYDLEELISIKSGKVASKDFEFAKSSQVSPLVQSPLSDLFTEDKVTDMFDDVNGLFQFATGSSVRVNFPSGEGDSIAEPELMDWSKVYSQATGKLVTPGLGYRFGSSATLVVDNILDSSYEQDGKFIIK